MSNHKKHGRRRIRKPILISFCAFCALCGYSAEQRPLKDFIEIRVAKDDWGGAEPENIRLLLGSVAREFEPYFSSRKIGPVRVSHGNESPIVLFGKPDAGEIRVHLTSQGNFWAQYSYQFAHELCHILCHYEKNDGVTNSNQWFEESLCEMASLFAVRRMAVTWKTDPPYPNWKSFAPHLADYADDMMKQKTRMLPDSTTLAAWYVANEEELRHNATLRDKNAVVAAVQLPIFETDPKSWEAVNWLNDASADGAQSFRDYLRAWRDSAPARHKPVIEKIAAQFGIALPAQK